MIRLAGRRHLRHRVFHGPAERTLVEVWLTDLAGLVVNGYPEPHALVGERGAPSWRLNPYGGAMAERAPMVPVVNAAASASRSPAPVPAASTAPVQRLVSRGPGTAPVRRAA